MTVEQAAARMYAAYDAMQAIDRDEDFDAYFEARLEYSTARELYDEAYAHKARGYVATVRKA